jgi:hypothetical protein
MLSFCDFKSLFCFFVFSSWLYPKWMKIHSLKHR